MEPWLKLPTLAHCPAGCETNGGMVALLYPHPGCKGQVWGTSQFVFGVDCAEGLQDADSSPDFSSPILPA